MDMKSWPPLFQLLGKSLYEGILAGWALLILMLIFNIGGFSDIILHGSNPVLAPFVLAALMAITFGSVSMGIAIMTMPYPDKDPDDTL